MVEDVGAQAERAVDAWLAASGLKNSVAIAQSGGAHSAADFSVEGIRIEVKRLQRPGSAALVAEQARRQVGHYQSEAFTAQSILILVQAFDEHLKRGRLVVDWVQEAVADPDLRKAIDRLARGGQQPADGELSHGSPGSALGIGDLEALADSTALAEADLATFEQDLDSDTALSEFFEDSARELAEAHNLDLARAKRLILVVVVLAYATVLIATELSQDRIPVMLLGSLLSVFGLDALKVGGALRKILDAQFPPEELAPPDAELEPPASSAQDSAAGDL
jgi:hypothetical protein